LSNDHVMRGGNPPLVEKRISICWKETCKKGKEGANKGRGEKGEVSK